MFGLFKKHKQEEAVVEEAPYVPTPLAQAIIDATEDYDRWDWFETPKVGVGVNSLIEFITEGYVFVDKDTGVDFNQYHLSLRHAPAGMAFEREDKQEISKALRSMRRRYEQDKEQSHARQCREQLEAAYMEDKA